MLTVITNIILTVMVTVASVKMPVNTLKQEVVTPVQEEVITGTINMEHKTENSPLENQSYGEKKVQKQESQVGKDIEEQPSSDISSPTSNSVIDIPSVTLISDQDKVEKANEGLQTALAQAFGQVDSEVVSESNSDALSPIEVSTHTDEQNETQDLSQEVEIQTQTIEEANIAVARNFTPVEEEQEILVETQSYEANPSSESDATDDVYKDYRQTFYSVESGEVKVGYGLNYNDSQIKNINNVMHYYDAEYEWLPIVAVNINEVLEVGLDERGIPNYYGTILEITYPEGDTQKAIVLDACGACSWDNRIDLWVYSQDYEHDVKGIEYRIIREGFKEDDQQQGS